MELKVVGWKLSVVLFQGERHIKFVHKCGDYHVINIDEDEGNAHYELEQVINHIC